ncbi:MAG: RDD family protein [Actinobacteria bacterium]|nr:RDD family protein [Actinomycetota bacterium]
MTFKRILALIFDWVAAILVVQVIPNGPDYGTQSNSLLTLLVFAIEVTLFTWMMGSSFGQRIVGLRVRDLIKDSNPTFAQSVFRTLLIVLLVPPLLADAEGRGLHDRIAKTKITNV